MITVRVVGIVLGMALLLATVVQRRRGRVARGDTLLWVAVAMGIIVLATVPAAAHLFTSLFRLPHRLSAVLVPVAVVFAWLLARTRPRLHGVEQRFGQLIRNAAARFFHEATGCPGGESSVAIVIPAHDGRAAIEGVLRDVPEHANCYRVDPLVVVDGGTDDTERIVLGEGYSVAAHPVIRGQGDALRTGFSIALNRGAHMVVTMDAECQHHADQLELLISPIVAGEADHVQGSRLLSEYADSGSIRSLGIRIFTRLINPLSRTRITDCANGFRAIRADKLALLDLREDRCNGPEIIMEAAMGGLRMMEECPSTCSDELTGPARGRRAWATRWACSAPSSGCGSAPDAPPGPARRRSPSLPNAGATVIAPIPPWHHLLASPVPPPRPSTTAALPHDGMP